MEPDSGIFKLKIFIYVVTLFLIPQLLSLPIYLASDIKTNFFISMGLLFLYYVFMFWLLSLSDLYKILPPLTYIIISIILTISVDIVFALFTPRIRLSHNPLSDNAIFK
jgi:hypothetical protein